MKYLNMFSIRNLSLLTILFALSILAISCGDGHNSTDDAQIKADAQTESLIFISKAAAEEFIKNDGNPIVQGTAFGDRFTLEATQLMTASDSSSVYSVVLKSLKEQTIGTEQLSFVLYNEIAQMNFWKAILPISATGTKVAKDEYLFGKVIILNNQIKTAENYKIRYMSIGFFNEWPAKKEESLVKITKGKFIGREILLVPYK